MKFTIPLIALLSITTSWAKKEQMVDEAKDKREAAVGYPSGSHSYQAPSLSNEGASSISIGAGYSVGGAKPGFSSYEGQGFSGAHSLPAESLPASGHATIQLAPITLQPSHGGLVGTDLNQLMSQLQHQLNSGALSLQTPENYGGSIQSEGHDGYNFQEQAVPQYTFSAPKQQYSIAEQQPQPSIPSYAAGTKGLGSYSSTGPVLFNPSEAKQTNAPSFNYAAPSAGHSFGGHSLGSAAQYFSGASGSIGESLSGGHSLSDPYKSFGNSYAPSGKNTFKPSAYIGSSVQADPSHGIPALSGSYGTPSYSSAPSLSGSHGALSLGSASHGISLGSGHSLGSSLSGHSLGSNSLGGHSLGSSSFGGHSLSSGSLGGHSLNSGGHGISLGSGGLSLSSGGHGSHGALSLGSGGLGASFGGSHGGFGGGSSKYISNAYLPAKDSFGSLSSHSSGLYAPPATNYGIPNSVHSASSHSPQYYKSQPSYNFGAGSSSYRSPSSSSSSLKSYPKFSTGGYSSLSSLYGSPKDPLQGAYSENTYNTIKYSEELKAMPQ